MNAIEIRGLAKNYTTGFWRKKQRRGLLPLDLTVEEGEVFGYLGPNGAGKTTTLKLLLGLIFPTAGSALIRGFDSQDPRVKAQLGFLPEQPYFYDYLTASELLHYYGELSGMARSGRGSRVREMLERVGLADAANLQLRKFSKGMLQRVGLAQAILHDPSVIFLDEPMSGLDPIGRREVRDLMQSLKHEGKTVFFSTHILSDAEDLCDRVAVLHHGELRGVGVVSQLLQRSTGKVEVLCEGTAAASAIGRLGGSCVTVGDTVRASVEEDRLNAVLEAIRQSHSRLISVTPVRSTLEEYFVERLAGSAGDAAGREKVKIQ